MATFGKLWTWGVLGAMASVAAGAAATADELPAWLTERRIIGENNLEPIEATKDSDVYEKSRLVARVETTDGMGFCTGSRVGEDLFLTNFHCYEFTPCSQLQFHLGYEAELPQDQHVILRCKEVLAQDVTLDYALYRVQAEAPPPAGDVTSHEFLGLGVAIPDGDREGLRQSFTLDQDGELLDLRVKLKISHTYIGDLKITLTSPTGTVVTLHDGAGGSADNIDKTYGALDGLSAVAGQAIAGEWVLHVVDNANQDAGTLEDVTFIVTTASEESVQAPAALSAAELAIDFPIATLSAAPLVVDQPLLIASHPSARLKEVDRSEGCKLRSVDIEIVAERRSVTHTCDTEGGSSGSPVLDRETGHVVALHWGGTNEYNLSIPMGLILKDLETKLPAVYGELRVAE